jgi:hypothetical protein
MTGKVGGSKKRDPAGGDVSCERVGCLRALEHSAPTRRRVAEVVRGLRAPRRARGAATAACPRPIPCSRGARRACTRGVAQRRGASSMLARAGVSSARRGLEVLRANRLRTNEVGAAPGGVRKRPSDGRGGTARTGITKLSARPSEAVLARAPEPALHALGARSESTLFSETRP